MTRPPAVGIVIADDHPIVREGFRKLLEAEPSFVVLGEAGDGFEAVAQVRKLRPDVLLMDLAMPRMSGLDALRALTAGPAVPTRSILLTASIRDDEIVRAVHFGVRGIVLKDAGSRILFKCIHAVMQGEFWLGRSMVDSLIDALHAPPALASCKADRFGLTPRQLEIAAAVAAGLSNKQIAARLGVSEDTVKHHLTRIFEKLGLSTRVELALLVTRHERGTG